MNMTKTLGHIDCPSCGTQNGVRITLDKNGHPFGFCEVKCRQQLRVGGDEYRVALFVARYPWAAVGSPVTVTVTDTVPAKPEQKPVPAPVPTPAKAAPKPAPAPAKPAAPEPAPAPAKKAGFWTPIMGGA